jgi:hypothetical protein
MSFLAELYRSKAESSERQFGGDNNAALTSFVETAGKCQQLSVALRQAPTTPKTIESKPAAAMVPAPTPTVAGAACSGERAGPPGVRSLIAVPIKLECVSSRGATPSIKIVRTDG